MAKYRVGLTKTVVYTGTVVVDIPADDADEAATQADELVSELNVSIKSEEEILTESPLVVGKMVDWYEDSTTYEVEDIEDDD